MTIATTVLKVQANTFSSAVWHTGLEKGFFLKLGIFMVLGYWKPLHFILMFQIRGYKSNLDKILGLFCHILQERVHTFFVFIWERLPILVAIGLHLLKPVQSLTSYQPLQKVNGLNDSKRWMWSGEKLIYVTSRAQLQHK